VEVVRRSAQITSVAVKRGSESILGLDGGCETGKRVRGARRRRDTLIGEPLIRWERLEQPHDGFEECHSFGALRAASGKARNIQSAHAGSVRLPLVLPQFLIGTIVGVVFPEGIHEAEGRAGALGRKQTGNARIRARGVAVLLEGQVALIGPQAMNGPAVARPSGGAGVPELGLEQETPWRLETAGVLASWCATGGRPSGRAARRNLRNNPSVHVDVG